MDENLPVDDLGRDCFELKPFLSPCSPQGIFIPRDIVEGWFSPRNSLGPVESPGDDISPGTWNVFFTPFMGEVVNIPEGLDVQSKVISCNDTTLPT